MRVSLNTSLDVEIVDRIGKIARAQRRRVSQVVEEAINFWLQNARTGARVRGEDHDDNEEEQP